MSRAIEAQLYLNISRLHMKIPCRTIRHMFLVSALLVTSLLVSPATLAAETGNTTEAVNTTETVKPAETSMEAPARHLTWVIGLEYNQDSSIAGQEIIQKDVPIGFSFETEAYLLEVSIPYVQRSAPSGKVAKSHHHESKKDPTTITPIVTSEGLGDVTSSLRYTLLNEKVAPLSLYARGEVKLATADVAKGLGTGVNDYFAELKASKTVGAFTGSASIGYAFMGSPGEVKINDVKKFLYFNNIYFGSVSGSYQFTESTHADLNLDIGQATETGGTEQRDLSAAVEFKASANQSIRMQVLKSIAPGISSWGASAYLSSAL